MFTTSQISLDPTRVGLSSFKIKIPPAEVLSTAETTPIISVQMWQNMHWSSCRTVITPIVGETAGIPLSSLSPSQSGLHCIKISTLLILGSFRQVSGRRTVASSGACADNNMCLTQSWCAWSDTVRPRLIIKSKVAQLRYPIPRMVCSHTSTIFISPNMRS